MSIELPNARNIFIPIVPDTIEDKALRDYLLALRSSIEAGYTKAFDNAKAIAVIINTATGGTFVASNGATVSVLNGLITALT